MSIKNVLLDSRKGWKDCKINISLVLENPNVPKNEKEKINGIYPTISIMLFS
nr:hypothetical protein [uncultured Mediterranean phage uvMED]